jgi:SAM-dependent methyltransferase
MSQNLYTGDAPAGATSLPAPDTMAAAPPAKVAPFVDAGPAAGAQPVADVEPLPLGAREDYNLTPYPRHTQTWTHPRRMAALATLVGLEVADPHHCRILELGCATGSNLIPIAVGLPQSECVGIDLSEAQIAIGQADVDALGLRNIRLLAMDLRNVGPELGQFDYIICHGIYSWVPAEARTAILRIMSTMLTPTGIAYLSWNVYPGWHLQQPLRQAMLYHTRNMPTGLDRARESVAFLERWADGLPVQMQGQAWLVRSLSEKLLSPDDENEESRLSYVLHEFLADYNKAFYFHEFAAEIERYDLQYVTDADFPTEFPRSLSADTVEMIQSYSDTLHEMLQYLDFFTFRMFRRSLLTHKGRELVRNIKPQRLLGLYVHTLAQEELPTPSLRSPLPMSIMGPDEVRLTSNHPLSKAALRLLTEPARPTFLVEDLMAAARLHLQAEAPDEPLELDEDDDRQLLATLLRAICTSDFLIALSAGKPPYALQTPARPVANRWARRQVLSERTVTSARLERMLPDPMEADLIRLLDGSVDPEQLTADWMAAVENGTIVLGNPPMEPEEGKAFLPKAVKERLQVLLRNALLEPEADA